MGSYFFLKFFSYYSR